MGKGTELAINNNNFDAAISPDKPGLTEYQSGNGSLLVLIISLVRT